MKKKKIFRWLWSVVGGVLLLLLILQATFFFFGDEILKKSILMGFQRYSQQAFEASRQPTLDFDDLSLNLLNGNFSVSGLHFSGYLPTQSEDIAADYIRLKVPEANIEGLDFLKLYKEARVQMETINFLHPDIQLVKAEKADSLKMNAQESIRASTASLHRLIRPYLKSFGFDQLRISDGNLFITRQGEAASPSNQLHAEHVYISLNDFLLDSLSLENTERLFFTKSFEVQLGEYQIITPDSSYLIQSDTLGYSSNEEKIYLKNLRAFPLNSVQVPTNVSFSVPQVTLTTVDWKEIYFDSLFHSESLIIERPELRISKQNQPDSLRKSAGFNLKKFSSAQLFPLLEKKFRAFTVSNLSLQEGKLILEQTGEDTLDVLEINDIAIHLGGIRMDTVRHEHDSLQQLLPADTLSIDLQQIKLYLPDRLHYMTARGAQLTTSRRQNFLCNVILDSLDVKPGYDSLEQLLLLPPEQELAYQIHIPQIKFEGIHLEVLNQHQAALLDSIYIHQPDIRIANFIPPSLGKQAAGFSQYDLVADSLLEQETVKSQIYDWSQARLNLSPFIAPGDSTAFLQWLHAGKLQLDSGSLEIVRADTVEIRYQPVTSIDTFYTSLQDIKIDQLPNDTVWRADEGRVAVRASEVDVFIQKGQFRLPGEKGRGGLFSVKDGRISTLNQEIYLRNIYFWTNPGYPPNMDLWLHRMYIPYVELKDIDLQKLYQEQVAEAKSFSAYAPRLTFNYRETVAKENRIAFDFENLYPQISPYLNTVDVKSVNLSRGELVVRKIDRNRTDSLFTTQSMNLQLSQLYIDSLTRMSRLRPFYAYRLKVNMEDYRWNFLPENPKQRLTGVMGESLNYDSYEGQLDAVAPKMLVNPLADQHTDHLELHAQKIMADDFDPYQLIHARKLHLGRLIVHRPLFSLAERTRNINKTNDVSGWKSLQPDMNQLLNDRLQQIDLRFVHVERGRLKYLKRAARDTLSLVQLDSVDFLAKNIKVDGSQRRHEHHILYADDVDYSLISGELFFNQPDKHQIRIDKATLKRRDASLSVEGFSIQPATSLKRDQKNTHLVFQSDLLELSGVDLKRAYLYGDMRVQRVTPTSINLNVALGDTKPQSQTRSVSIHDLLSPYIRKISVGEVRLPTSEVTIKRKSDGEEIFATREFAATISDFRLDDELLNAPATTRGRVFYTRNIRANIKDYAYQTGDGLYRLHADDVSLATASRSLTLNNLSLQPLVDRGNYLQRSQYAFTLAEAEISQVKMQGLDFVSLLNEDKWHVSEVNVLAPELKVMRENRLPRDESRRPPLHQKMIAKLQQPIKIDKLLIRNGQISYAELAEDSPKEGVISFEDLNAEIRNISNDQEDIRQNTMMEMDVNAKVMGEGYLEAFFRFPLDTTSMDFNVRGSLGPMNLTHFNQIMEPVAFVHIKEGQNQQMQFEFSGDDKKSTGTMEFRYDDLSVLMIDKQKGQAGLDEKLGSFIANAFVLKGSNPKSVFLRIGNIAFERDPSRAMFHYWWQSLLSGIKSSIGLEKNTDKTKDFSHNDGS